jgi:NDP-mannose synthase
MHAALIMAGGRSERMRATLGRGHKALVCVLGVPMLERNLCQLLAAGFDDITVAISAHEPAIADYIQGRGQALGRAHGATVSSFVEHHPLGTIGVAGALRDRSEALLVVNVDNLSTLDLKALVSHHHRSGAALTIATHHEPFQIPFGEVSVCDGRMLRYLEKPVRHIPVSSGTYVLAARACALLPRDCRTDIPQLFNRLVECGESIAAFVHEAAWIDVNDAAAVARAEELISEHAQAFECWVRNPDFHVVSLVPRSPFGILVKQRTTAASRYRGMWDLPGKSLPPMSSPTVESLLDCIREKHRWPRLQPEFLTSFDDFDGTTRHLIRHHVYVAPSDQTWLLPSCESRVKWIALAERHASLPLSPAAVRAMAALRRRM